MAVTEKPLLTSARDWRPSPSPRHNTCPSLSAYSDLALFMISDGFSPYNSVSTAPYFAFQSTICVTPFSDQVKVRGE